MYHKWHPRAGVLHIHDLHRMSVSVALSSNSHILCIQYELVHFCEWFTSLAYKPNMQNMRDRP